MTKQKLLLHLEFIALLTLLTLAAFWKILFFGFWIDDWPLLWATVYHVSYSIRFYNHPGLPLQFLLLTRFFGTDTTLWMIYGLGIKILVAFLVATLFKTFTKSNLVGFLSGIFFAVSYAGLEIMADPAANTPGVIAIPILLSLLFFMQALSGKKKYLFWSGVLLFIAFILDPARVIPVFLLLPLIFCFFPKTKANKSLQHLLLKIFVVVVVVFMPLLFLWFGKYEYDSQIAHAITGFFHTPLFILSKVNRVGNMLASIANLFTGSMHTMRQDVMNTAYYQRIFGVEGFVLLLVLIFGFWQFLKKNSKAWGIVAFCIVWTFLFYLPNFLSEPRAPMALPHRYLFLSSIGYVGLIAYLLSKISIRPLLVILACGFIVLNIYQANVLLSWQATYRSARVLDGFWNTVIKDVGNNKKGNILFFTGKEPYVGQDLQYPGTWGFLVKEKLNIPASEFPIVTTDEKYILAMLCGKTLYKDTRGKMYVKEKVSISHLYSWNVVSSEKIVNTSLITRAHFVQLAKQKGCELQ